MTDSEDGADGRKGQTYRYLWVMMLSDRYWNTGLQSRHEKRDMSNSQIHRKPYHTNTYSSSTTYGPTVRQGDNEQQKFADVVMTIQVAILGVTEEYMVTSNNHG